MPECARNAGFSPKRQDIKLGMHAWGNEFGTTRAQNGKTKAKDDSLVVVVSLIDSATVRGCELLAVAESRGL